MTRMDADKGAFYPRHPRTEWNEIAFPKEARRAEEEEGTSGGWRMGEQRWRALANPRFQIFSAKEERKE